MKFSRFVSKAACLGAAALLAAGCAGSTNDTSNADVSSVTSSIASSQTESVVSSKVATRASKSEPGGKQYQAEIKISGYDEPIIFTMDEGIAPETVDNFVNLAEKGFYDGLTFHRIIDGFMIQGGDPRGDGTGGSSRSIYGEFKSNGFDNSLKHVRGTVSMARSNQPDSASSQFFIVQEDASSLDGEYAAFGTVTSGMDVVDQIAESAKPTDNNGSISKEDQPVIESITIIELDDKK